MKYLNFPNTKDKSWGKSDDIQLQRVMLAEKSFPKVAKIMGLSLYSVQRRAHRLGLKILDWKKKPLTSFQKEMLYGTLLGDGSLHISKGCHFPRFVCNHGLKQEQYLRHKYKILKNICLSEPKVFSNREGYGGQVIRMATATHPDLQEIYRNTHKRKKKTVTPIWLEKITPISLAYFFQDDGSTNQRWGVNISTNGFSKYENQLIVKMFKKRFGFDAKVLISKRPTIDLPKEYAFISFRSDSGRKFLKFLEPHIHKSMRYKLGPQLKCPLCGAKYKYGQLKKLKETT